MKVDDLVYQGSVFNHDRKDTIPLHLCRSGYIDH